MVRRQLRFRFTSSPSYGSATHQHQPFPAEVVQGEVHELLVDHGFGTESRSCVPRHHLLAGVSTSSAGVLAASHAPPHPSRRRTFPLHAIATSPSKVPRAAHARETLAMADERRAS